MKNIKNNQKGFTLFELIIVIVLSGIVLVSLAGILAEGFRNYSVGKNIINADWQARYVLERMTRELRSIYSNQSIINPQATSLTIITSDGSTISYQLSGSQLQRTSGGITQVLADAVNSLNLSYYATNGSVTAVNTSVKYIGIDVGINYGDVTSTLSTIVYPWNLK